MGEESNHVAWAREELKRAGLFDQDSDYEGMMGDAVLDLVKTLSEAGHSGFSASWAAALFQKLARWETLTPLTSDPDEWMDVGGMRDEPMWQSRRNPSCFSQDGGKTFYDLNERPKWWRKLVAKFVGNSRRSRRFHRSVARG